MEEAMKESLIETLRSSVFKESESLEGNCPEAEGYDFDEGVDYSQLLRSMVSGFQASSLGEAIEIVNQMLDWRLADEAIAEDCNEEKRDPAYRESIKCKVFLGCTSNLISSGVRDTIRYLVKHHMVDVVVTTAGGIEQDLIKCLAPTFIGDFSLPGDLLRSKGLNRIGNLLIPDNNYCKFKDWIIPIFDQMLKEQEEENVLWTPSKVYARLGKEINNESSYLYWAYKNNIPVFCPAPTDGYIGNMWDLHSTRNPALILDLVQDIGAINGEAVHASPRKTGMIILGGGCAKHHICNANMMRNGADFAVFINTAQEFDGSDSRARPDEAVSWGKIRPSAKTVKVHCDATVAFPLLVAETFASRREKNNCQKAATAATELLTVKRFRAISLARAEELKQKEEVMNDSSIESVRSTVFKESETLEGKNEKAEGYDFDKGMDYSQLLKSMVSTGFQGSNLGEAIEIVNQMLDWRLADEAISEDCNEEERDPKCKVFLGFTSNLISSGLRDIIRYLVQHHMVDVVVTTAGGIEEDLIKCLAPTVKGDFSLPGALLRSKKLNRIGNLLIPNNNYCKFEDWIIPIIDQMLKEQKEENVLWTPSKINARLGKEINNESSYLYWAYKNNIPVFCPAPTDGSLGDMFYCNYFRSPGLILDLSEDSGAMEDEAVHASTRKTGMIILGGGAAKRQICNAMMMRDGADFAVFIDTAPEFAGSDSWPSIDEAASWGMIRASATAVKVHCDATIAFPLLVAGTFASRRDKIH